MKLIQFDPFEAGDGPLYIRAQDVECVMKAPNRQKAARIFYYAHGDHQIFDSKMTPAEASAAVNAALAAGE